MARGHGDRSFDPNLSTKPPLDQEMGTLLSTQDFSTQLPKYNSMTDIVIQYKDAQYTLLDLHSLSIGERVQKADGKVSQEMMEFARMMLSSKLDCASKGPREQFHLAIRDKSKGIPSNEMKQHKQHHSTFHDHQLAIKADGNDGEETEDGREDQGEEESSVDGSQNECTSLLEEISTNEKGTLKAKIRSTDFLDKIKECEEFVVGYFVSKRFDFNYVKDAVSKVWKTKADFEMKLQNNNLFLFKFDNSDDKEKVLELGAWITNSEQNGTEEGWSLPKGGKHKGKNCVEISSSQTTTFGGDFDILKGLNNEDNTKADQNNLEEESMTSCEEASDAQIRGKICNSNVSTIQAKEKRTVNFSARTTNKNNTNINNFEKVQARQEQPRPLSIHSCSNGRGNNPKEDQPGNPSPGKNYPRNSFVMQGTQGQHNKHTRERQQAGNTNSKDARLLETRTNNLQAH
ncbi:hypothetical protein GIB67_012278 [Kingdonia uniflora]|uniref:DUF4283 domain-containing protein n=1 Tax=Kingdonia uniflora TaxID=39325 RepID=A0A7J7LFT8_9MAGN|nr:hypothetical protein GIB67_012278 [Kingdonia uniflora]